MEKEQDDRALDRRGALGVSGLAMGRTSCRPPSAARYTLLLALRILEGGILVVLLLATASGARSGSTGALSLLNKREEDFGEDAGFVSPLPTPLVCWESQLGELMVRVIF